METYLQVGPYGAVYCISRVVTCANDRQTQLCYYHLPVFNPIVNIGPHNFLSKFFFSEISNSFGDTFPPYVLFAQDYQTGSLMGVGGGGGGGGRSTVYGNAGGGGWEAGINSSWYQWQVFISNNVFSGFLSIVSNFLSRLYSNGSAFGDVLTCSRYFRKLSFCGLLKDL